MEQIFKVENLINIVFSGSMLYITLSFFNAFFGTKINQNKILKYMIFSVYFVSKFTRYSFHFESIVNILMAIISIFVMCILYKSKIRYKLFATLLNYVLNMIVEVFVTYGFCLVGGIKLSFAEIDLTIINSIIILILLVIVKCFEKLRKKNQFEFNHNINDFLKLLITPILSICILYILHIETINNFDIGIIIVALFVLTINITFYVLYEKIAVTNKINLENKILLEKNKSYISQYIETQKHLVEIRKIKHDIKHHILYIRSQLEKDNSCNNKDLLEELNKLIELKLNNKSKQYTSDTSLNYMLNYRESLINSKSININIEVIENGKSDIIDNSIFYIVLGNLLDNATENFDNAKSVLKSINLKIIIEKGNVYIKISNPFSHNLNYLENELITNKADQINHGFGLRNIKNLISENGGYIKLSTENNIFTVQVVLLNKAI